MEYKFTASVVMAMRFLLNLVEGKTQEVEVMGDETLERPVWCNFDFFDQIKASPIQRTKRFEPTQERGGAWRLKRTVQFYFHGSCVAIVALDGVKHDGNSNDHDNGSFWAIYEIGYFCSISGGPSCCSMGDWRRVKVATALSGR